MGVNYVLFGCLDHFSAYTDSLVEDRPTKTYAAQSDVTQTIPSNIEH